MKIYLIVDDNDCYGAGKTSKAAWDEAKQYELEGGGDTETMREETFFAEWPPNSENMDGQAWLNYRDTNNG